MEKNFYMVKNKRLAEALTYLSYTYYKFNDDGEITYSFEDSETLRKDIKTLKELRALRNSFNY